VIIFLANGYAHCHACNGRTDTLTTQHASAFLVEIDGVTVSFPEREWLLCFACAADVHQGNVEALTARFVGRLCEIGLPTSIDLAKAIFENFLQYAGKKT
jgi:hypothetical protein